MLQSRRDKNVIKVLGKLRSKGAPAPQGLMGEFEDESMLESPEVARAQSDVMTRKLPNLKKKKLGSSALEEFYDEEDQGSVE